MARSRGSYNGGSSRVYSSGRFLNRDTADIGRAAAEAVPLAESKRRDEEMARIMRRVALSDEETQRLSEMSKDARKKKGIPPLKR